MRIIYYPIDSLKSISLCHFDREDVAFYLSSHKSFPVIVYDNNSMPLGYYSYKSFPFEDKSKNICLLKFQMISKEFDFTGTVVYSFFEKNPLCICVPVIDNQNRILGAYINDDETTNSFTSSLTALAYAYLPIFGKDVNDFIICNFQRYYFVGTKTQYKELSEYVPCVSFVKHNDYANSEEKSPKTIIIDSIFSKSYRNQIFKDPHQATLSSLDDIMAAAIVKKVITYVRNRNSTILIVEGPIFEKTKYADSLWPQLNKISYREAVNNKKLTKHFASSVIYSENNLTTDGVSYIMSDYVSTDLNVCNGIRTTLPVSNGKYKIYCYGPCLTFGACVQDNDTISSYMQRRLNDRYPNSYVVYNYGVNYGKNVLNDFVRILNSTLNPGDYVVLINSFSTLVRREIERYEHILTFSEYFNKINRSGCYFLDNMFHCNGTVNKHIADFICKNIEKSHMKETSLFCGSSKKSISLNVNLERLLDQGLLQHYIEYIDSNKFKCSLDKIIGAVLITANPLTKGHQYLIDIAEDRCDFLYVFIVENNNFHFSYLDRFEMVRQYCKKKERVKVLSTGHLMTAKFTFPEYFTKEASNTANSSAIPEFHAKVFGKIVCKYLNISKRFVGEEEEGSVTDKYNKYIKKILPQYGVEVIEIKRCCDRFHNVISSSKARKCLNTGNMSLLKECVSDKTIDYITHNYIKHEVIRKGQWTKNYIRGKHFYKVYNFYMPEAIEREKKACLAAMSSGLLTPVLLRFNRLSRTACLCFEYLKMNSISNKMILSSPQLQEQILAILKLIPSVKWPEDDTYWKVFLIEEFKYAISFLPESFDKNKYLHFLQTLSPEVFIHGDFITHNIGLWNGKIVVYDFQHGSLGPKGFDKAYLASCFLSIQCGFLYLNNLERFIAESMAAVRLGRAYRNNYNADEIYQRKCILESWQQLNQSSLAIARPHSCQ